MTVASSAGQPASTSPPPSSAALNRRAAEGAETRMLINGWLCESGSGARFDNVSPATGQVLGWTSAASADDMDAAIAAARKAFDTTTWSTDRSLRQRCLRQLQFALEREREKLRDEIIAEGGAPLMTTTMAQLDWPLSDALTGPAELIDRFGWERDLGPGTTMGGHNRRRVYKEPIGVVAAIAPWNFPFEIVLNKLGQALATGNTVIVKPDSNTPWSSTRIGRLIAAHTDIPPGVVNVVPTPDNAVAQRLVTDPRVDMISFTGSPEVGRLIGEKGAQTYKRVFLELGGKSAMVVLDDADLDTVVPRAAQVCMHAGQGCGINTRALVPRRMYDEYVDKAAAMFNHISAGDPARPDTVLGPVINATQQARILGFIDRARAGGAEIAVGGTAPRDLDAALAGGTYVSPTLVVGIDNSFEIARREVFGPVLVVLPYDDDEEALAIANDSDYGLSGSVYSHSPERALAFAKRMRTGSVNVNNGLFYGADAPYGGYKTSGVGRQNGIEGFEQHLETKVIGYG
ncbi:MULTISPECIES: aldehyde dehydrogenase family protein [unclassified Mycobacterium]|uniref:aldehyde dehydrogenase family protein n=1 Tax=unclassified Mycobacterium TaxID=2642494 RepID=UPI0029C98ED4|nr:MULTISPECIES: aldehyde dehydrogenase family protein [unclassified Mycobacterium]